MKRGHSTFLSYSRSDQLGVEALAHKLRGAGIEPWLDKWNLVPGEPWQPALEQALGSCASASVCIGPSGIGPWQHEEMRAAISARVIDPSFRVIPVLLPGSRRPERGPLPAFLRSTTWVDFRDGLEDEEALHRLVCGIRGESPGARDQHQGPVACPYRGLRVFEAEHADIFYGREALTEWLVDAIQPGRRRDNRFLAVVGASGSGKSSLVRAGLVPALNSGVRIKDSDRWPACVLRPGSNPLEELAIALKARLRRLRPGVSELVADLRTSPESLHRQVRVALHDEPEDLRVLLVVDQFEETFTMTSDEGDRRSFIESLVYAAMASRGRVIVVLTMRADFYGKCALYDGLAAALSETQFLVGPMSESELRMAIEQPALAAGANLEPGLTELLIRDLRDEPGALPLLQHALVELWERRNNNRMTIDAYDEIDRLGGALERHANRVLTEFDEAEREVCQRVFLRLTQPGEGTEDTKRRVALDELLPAEGDDELVRVVIDLLVRERLITTEGGEERSDSAIIEVAHEALIKNWSAFRHWVESDRDALRVQRRLGVAAVEWDKNGRHESYLYRGPRLLEAGEWSRKHAGDMSALEQEYLGASESNQIARRMRAQRRRLALRLGFFVASVAAIVAFWFYRSADAARENEQRAHDEASKLAASNEVLLEASERSLAELFADRGRAAIQEHRLEEALVFLAAASIKNQEDFPSQLLFADTKSQLELLIADLHGHDSESSVSAVAFNADGSMLATTGSDRKTRVWDGNSGRLLSVREHPGEGTAVAFCGDGQRLLTGDNMGCVTVTELDAARSIEGGEWHLGGINALAVGGQGNRVVTVGNDSEAVLCDLGDDSNARSSILGQDIVRARDDRLLSVAISPDGQLVATGGEVSDHAVRLWNEATHETTTLGAHGEVVTQVEFLSPRHLGARDKEGRLLRWDLTKPGPAEVVVEDASAFAASANSSLIAYGDPRGAVLVMQAVTNEPVFHWKPPLGRDERFADAVIDLAFCGIGARLAALTESGLVRVWDIGHKQTLMTIRMDGATSCRLDPAGTRLVVIGDRGKARLWDLRRLNTLGVSRIGEDKGLVQCFAVTPTGDVFFGDARGRLWRQRSSDTQPEPFSLPWPADRPVEHVVLSADGERCVAATFDRLAVFDTASLSPIGATYKASPGSAVSAILFPCPDPDSVVISEAPRRAPNPSGGAARTIVWTWPTGRERPVPALDGRRVSRHEAHAFGKLILSTGAGTTAPWEFEGRDDYLRVDASRARWVSGLADYVAAHDNEVRLHTYYGPQRFDEPLIANDTLISALQTGPHGLVASGDVSGQVRITSLRGGREVSFMAHAGQVTWIGFSSDGALLATTGFDRRLVIWDAASGRPIAARALDRDLSSAPVFGFAGQSLMFLGQSEGVSIWGFQGMVEEAQSSLAGILDAWRARWPKMQFNDRVFQMAIEELEGAVGGEESRTKSNSSLEAARLENLSGHPTQALETLAENTRPDSTCTDAGVLAQDLLSRFGGLLACWHGHPGATSARFDSTGSRIVTLGADGRASVWDVADKKCIASERLAAVTMWEATFCPTDSNLVAAIGRQSQCVLWDLETGEVRRVGEPSRIKNGALEFSEDGRVLGFADRLGGVNLLELEHDRLSRIAGEVEEYPQFDIDRDGRTVATAGKVVRLWNTTTGVGLELSRPPGVQEDFVRVRFRESAQGGREVIGVTDRGAVCRWDVVDGSLVGASTRRFSGTTSCIDVDGDVVVVGSSESEVLIHQLAANHAVVVGHAGSVYVERVVVKEASGLIATSARDGTARVWALNGAQVAALGGHDSRLVEVDLSADGRHVVTADGRGYVRLWAIDATARQRDDHEEPTAVRTAVMSDERGILVTGSEDGEVSIWRVDERGRLQARLLRERPHSNAVTDISFMSGGRVLTSDGETLQVWSLEPGAIAERLMVPVPSWSRVKLGPRGGLALLDDRGILAGSTSSTGSTINRIWDTSGVTPATVGGPEDLGRQGSEAEIAAISRVVEGLQQLGDPEIDVGGDHLFGFELRPPLILQPRGPTTLGQGRRSEAPLLVQDVAFHPSGRHLVATLSGGGVRSFDLRDGSTDWTLELPRGSSPRLVRFIPGSDRFVITRADGAASVWRWSENGAEDEGLLGGHDGEIGEVAFDEGGGVITIAEGTLKRWDLSTGLLSKVVVGIGSACFTLPTQGLVVAKDDAGPLEILRLSDGATLSRRRLGRDVSLIGVSSAGRFAILRTPFGVRLEAIAAGSDWGLLIRELRSRFLSTTDQ